MALSIFVSVSALNRLFATVPLPSSNTFFGGEFTLTWFLPRLLLTFGGVQGLKHVCFFALYSADVN